MGPDELGFELESAIHKQIDLIILAALSSGFFPLNRGTNFLRVGYFDN